MISYLSVVVSVGDGVPLMVRSIFVYIYARHPGSATSPNSETNLNSRSVSPLSPDKQQELDLPTVKVDHVEHPVKERNVEGKCRPMCQISGLRKLKHANSFTGIVPAHGVDTPHKEELTNVSGWSQSVGVVLTI